MSTSDNDSRWRGGVSLLAALVAIYHLVIVSNLPREFGYFLSDQIHVAIALASALILIFLTKPASARLGRSDWRWLIDAPLSIAAVAGCGFVIFNYDAILNYSIYGFLDLKGQILAAGLCVALFEAVRRTTGVALPILVGAALLMTIYQQHLPGILYGRGFDLDRLLYSAYVGEAGLFGLPLKVASKIIIVFLIFGALLQASGGGNWFLQLALALTGWARGGPAKAAVLASAMFGSISGSPSGNAATTGVLTIPLMKQVGYSPRFAAAVEAVASTGGQILPPVMGAIAFVMAEWIRVPYSEIVIAALVPAILYFVIVFVSVHLQAVRDGLTPLPRAQTPKLGAIFRSGYFYLVPILALVYFLMFKKYPPGMAGIYTLPFIVGVSFLSRDKKHHLTVPRLLEALASAVRGWVAIAAITSFVGLMIGALELSGVGIKISDFIIDLSAGDLLLTLLFVGASSLLLGMGLDSIPAYITLATLMAPALIQLGVDPVPAHLFVIYWGLASFITPPVCVAVFITSSISGSKLWETGWEALRLGIASFIVPFAFVLNAGLLLRGELADVAWAVVTALAGAVLIACGLRGEGFQRLGPLSRIVVFVGGLLMIGPDLVWPLTGLVMASVALAPGFLAARRRASATGAVGPP